MFKCIHCRGKIDATGVKQIALPVADALDIVAGNSTKLSQNQQDARKQRTRHGFNTIAGE